MHITPHTCIHTDVVQEGLQDISRQAQTKAGHDHPSGTAEGTYRNTIYRGERERLSHERTRVKVLRRMAEEGRTRKESNTGNR